MGRKYLQGTFLVDSKLLNMVQAKIDVAENATNVSLETMLVVIGSLMPRASQKEPRHLNAIA